MRTVIHLAPGFEPLTVKADHDLALEEMQRLVAGYIELWPKRVMWEGKPVQMVVNEVARINGSSLNVQASELAGTQVYGCVFLCIDKDMD